MNEFEPTQKEESVLWNIDTEHSKHTVLRAAKLVTKSFPNVALTFYADAWQLAIFAEDDLELRRACALFKFGCSLYSPSFR